MVLAAACGDGGGGDGGGTSDAQLPPTGAAQVRAWIEAGHYLDWRCEPAGHDARDPSPHGRNRICNNDAITAGSGDFPLGAAAVKELLDSSDNIIGHAVYRKDAAGAGGAGWYWYEDVNGDVVADGAGTAGVPRDVCADCHSHAERDFVFTIVP
ncbi:MAG: hypothetical protein K8M05_26360 [Deltaproteobacteria bacterium]|nr:hypothetical protein [Kofleriaceae bacterium]